MSSSSPKKTRRDPVSAQAPKRGLEQGFRKCFKPLPPLESKLRGGLVNLSSEELAALQQSLRDLQKPCGKTFWRLEQFIARIDDELERRRA
jgi:hypothetical protein